MGWTTRQRNGMDDATRHTPFKPHGMCVRWLTHERDEKCDEAQAFAK
jgi:hypothetical protein